MLSKRIIAIFLVIIVIILAVVILLMNQNTISFNSIGNNLKGYSNLKTGFKSLKLPQDTIKNVTDQFNILENNKSTPQDDYNSVLRITFFLSHAYSISNDHSIYSYIVKDLNSFAKTNFTKYYKTQDFKITCQDALCAESPQPTEIIKIINEINNLTSIPDYDKKAATQNLEYAMYFPNNPRFSKASMYYQAETNIRFDPFFIKANVNQKIADEIDAFIKQVYPDQYNKLNKPNINKL